VADLAYYVAGLIAVLAAAAKLAQSRTRPPPPGLLYLCAGLLCLGLSAVVLAPASLRLGAAAEPVPNLTRLIGNGLTAGAVFCVVAVLAHAADVAEVAKRRIRVQSYLLVATVATMAALLIAARTRFTVDFVNVYATHPLVVAYELVFLAFVTWGLLGIVMLLHRVARHAQRAFLRTGLRMLSAGAVFGLVWSLWKISMTLVRATTQRPAPAEAEVSSLLSAGSVLLIALGATLTAWGPRAVHPARWWRARRIHRRIEPLWSAVSDAVPQVEFNHPGAGKEFQLYHRIVEIRDCSLALRAYFHPDVAGWVQAALADHPVTEDDSAVLLEAANIAAALEAHRAGHEFRADPSRVITPHKLDADIDAEAHWLVRVADAFVHSAIVNSIRQRARDELSAAPASGRGSPSS
jgi:hypothetical protein